MVGVLGYNYVHSAEMFLESLSSIREEAVDYLRTPFGDGTRKMGGIGG